MTIDGEQVIDFATDDGRRARRRAPATLSLEAGDEHEVTIEYRGDAAVHRPRARLAAARVDASRQRLLARHRRRPSSWRASRTWRSSSPRRYENEQRDRASLTLPNDQDQLIRAVSAVNPNTVVVLGAAGPVLMPWLGRVDGGRRQSYFGGQEQGNAIADVLFGDVNPSGKLPITLPAQRAPARAARDREPVGHARRSHACRTTRASSSATAAMTAPAWTRCSRSGTACPTRASPTATSPSSRAGRRACRCSSRVRNTGQRTGAEAAQVYVGQLPTSVPTPPKQLAGFAKVTLDPGGRERVTVTLDRRAFSYFDEGRNAWVTPGGRVPIYVGSSSRDIRLTGSVTVPAGAEEPVVAARRDHRHRRQVRRRRRRQLAPTARAIQLYDCNGTAAQRWSVTSDGTLEALGKCLDVAGGATANGTAVQLYECNGTGAQQWEARPDGTLRNPPSGRCLDAAGASSANGTRLIIWDCHGGANQRWELP